VNVENRWQIKMTSISVCSSIVLEDHASCYNVTAGIYAAA